ncbi:RNA polymerase sigma factor RpoH [Candidatus Bealeia paramacronuclearis]|uniref:RNA polymerase sigma factor RpoH n=1 Tax=Candidatus Bealeia paramacronuclearis TaxID=1921001 RepID=A0ABZ2C3S8_9PROT|nr:RNA polymerase sigma factor RpoH [Candidatus Bealeia paramacronuclearis]
MIPAELEPLETPIKANSLSIPNAQEGLKHYFDQIRKFPMLDAEEEFMLAKRWKEHQDRKAAEKLISSHLRLVAKVAAGYKGYGLPMADLIAEGNVGLMRAVDKFDPDKGFRLSTYAMWWIRATIQDYVLHSWSLVKIGTTAAQKKLFFNLRRMKGELEDKSDFLSADSIALIAEDLNVSTNEVIEMNKRMQSGGDSSLNSPLNAGSLDEWQDWLVDESPNQEDFVISKGESQVKNALLHKALQSLDPREAKIIHHRRLLEDPKSLEELAQDLKISRERVRQIETRAFEKLQRAVKSGAIQLRIGGETGRG